MENFTLVPDIYLKTLTVLMVVSLKDGPLIL